MYVKKQKPGVSNSLPNKGYHGFINNNLKRGFLGTQIDIFGNIKLCDVTYEQTYLW